MEWRKVNYRGIDFVVSESGHVIYNGRFMKQSGRPYKKVKAWGTNHAVHRIVAKAFCKNYDEKLVVNHIRPVKSLNRASNLEWVSAKENVHHAFNNGLRHRGGKTIYLKKNINKCHFLTYKHRQ